MAKKASKVNNVTEYLVKMISFSRFLFVLPCQTKIAKHDCMPIWLMRKGARVKWTRFNWMISDSQQKPRHNLLIQNLDWEQFLRQKLSLHYHPNLNLFLCHHSSWLHVEKDKSEKNRQNFLLFMKHFFSFFQTSSLISKIEKHFISRRKGFNLYFIVMIMKLVHGSLNDGIWWNKNTNFFHVD